jgi:allantoicase
MTRRCSRTCPKIRARSRRERRPGTDVMIFKIFSRKNLAKKSAFLPQIKGNFAEKVIITSVFEKNASFFAENWQKNRHSRNIKYRRKA